MSANAKLTLRLILFTLVCLAGFAAVAYGVAVAPVPA